LCRRCVIKRRGKLYHLTEWDAADYAQISAMQKVMADEALSLLELRGSERVLDVGCGDGKITAQIAQRVPDGQAVGVDASSNMIAFAKEKFSNGVHQKLRFEVADAQQLRFSEDFDLVVSFNALHWIPEQDAVLQEIHSALRPGGKAQLRLVPRLDFVQLEDVMELVRKNPRHSETSTSDAA
jgi:trans-aconitate 2-methyltransferase